MTEQQILENKNSQIAEKSEKQETLKQMIAGDYMRQQIAQALPKHCTPDRFLRVALTAVMRKPDLLECTKESVIKCLLDLSSFGIEPDGRRAHLIPFNEYNKHTQKTTKICTLVLDYKGIAELVRRSGEVSVIHADVVRKKDKFKFAYGSKGCLEHEPNLEEDSDPYAFYSYIELKDGSKDWMVMSINQVEGVRDKSANWIAAKKFKTEGNTPWALHFEEMGKKTVFRRHSKWLPLSADLRRAVEYDDDAIEVPYEIVPDQAKQPSNPILKPSAVQALEEGEAPVKIDMPQGKEADPVEATKQSEPAPKQAKSASKETNQALI